MPINALLNQIREEIENISAVEVAEMFLSPFVEGQLLIEATSEPGPSLWIVNRSDVTSETLENLLKHPLSQISTRAAEKIISRKATISTLPPPVDVGPLEAINDYEVEDVLGHPLCSWDAMLFFARSLSEDHRLSACLSLSRRLWEHPAQSQDFALVKTQFVDAFLPLTAHDPSPLVRAYGARIPMWSSEQIVELVRAEQHPRVLAKLAQNNASSAPSLELSAQKASDDLYLRRVLALDPRLNFSYRRDRQDSAKDAFEGLIHEYYRSKLQ